MLDADALALRVDGFFHRDHVHADTGAARWNELCRQLQRLLRREVEHGCDLGVRVGERRVLHHVFAGADDPLRDPVLHVPVRVVAVLLDNADPQQVVDDLLRLLLAHVVAGGKLGGGVAEAALLEAEHEFDLILGQQPVEDPEIHVVFLHAAGELAGDGVGDHHSELFDELRLFRVVAVMAVNGVIPLVDVDVGVDFFYHRLTSVICCAAPQCRCERAVKWMRWKQLFASGAALRCRATAGWVRPLVEEG